MQLADTAQIASERTSARRLWLLALRGLVTVGILAVIFALLRPAELFTAMRKIGITLWVLAVITHVFIHVVVVAKWRILLSAAGTKTDLIDAIRAHGAGVFANLYLPSIVGGDVIRAGLVVPSRDNVAAVITGGVVDRITDCVSLVVISVGGLCFVPAAQTVVGLPILVVAACGIVASVFGIFVVLKLLEVKKRRSGVAVAILGIRQPIETMWKRKTATLFALAVSLCIQASFILQNIFIGNAIGINVSPAVWFVVWPIAKLASLTPLSIGGLGVREGTLAALLIPFSVPATLSVAESLIWQTIMYALGLVGGVISLWIRQFRSRRLAAITLSKA